MENFTIHSTSSDRSLTFSDLRGDLFQVDLKGAAISARVEVSAHTDALGVNKLLQELATYNKPWTGTKKWASLEGEFSISATCSTLGKVFFCIDLRLQYGGAEESTISTGITSELGQLLNIAKEAEQFFSSSS